MVSLFDPVRLGELALPNRMVMSPLTRCRAGEGRVPNARMAEYYTQRASAGLIIRRSDSYGGSIENRARLLLDVTDAAISVWGAGRVGVHLAPRGDAHDMGDADPAATFGYVAEALGRRNIAFIFTREHINAPTLAPALKKAFGGALIANEQITQASATQLLEKGIADAAAFGKAYIANPDLVARFRQNVPLNALDVETMYGGGSKGYTDYPALPC